MKATYLDLNQPVTFSCLSEQNFGQQMNQVVEPYLEQFKRSGYLNALYYELYSINKEQWPQCKGTLVISHGFGESCLKYHELIYYFHQQGYQVAILDHRGHGKSFREVKNKNIIHVNDFSDYVSGFHDFIQKRVKPMAAQQPLYLFAHSMGGCIGALYLQEYPDVFDRVVFNAPMFALKMEKYSLWMGRIICNTMTYFNRGKRRLFFHPGFRENESFSSCVADSQARFNYYHNIRRQEPCYQTSAASYKWSLAADKAGLMVTNRRRLKRITMPVLLFQAEADSLVTTLEHVTFLDGIKHGQFVIVGGTKHEIYRSKNKVLSRYLEMIFEFLQQS
jgi:lysophospholipase